MERYEIIYRLSADNMVEGVPAHEVAAVLYAFGDLVKKTLETTGSEGELKVNVKQFTEGSFITEFVVSYGSSLINFFTEPETTALANALGILGFLSIPGAVAIPKVVRKVKGHINEYRDNGDGTYSYGEGESAVTVDAATHAAVQSPDIAPLYRAVSVGPIVGWGNSINVTIQEKGAFERGETSGAAHFTSADEPDMTMYEHIAKNGVPEEREETVSMARGLVLSPESGPYDGDENGYTFTSGDNKYRRVKIHDLGFRMKLESGKVRFMNKDVLTVDMQTTQSVTKGGNISNSYVITKVINYKPYEPLEQTTIDDYTN